MEISIQKITRNDDSSICNIIKCVGAEFGAIGEGFGPSDSEVLHMSKYYTHEFKSLYLVARVDGVIVGGCGVAPFAQRDDICELRKLFLLPESRGVGIGRKLVSECLTYATLQKFDRCYLDTLKNMNSAICLYESMGFEHLSKPLEESLHSGCDIWMMKKL